VLGVPSTPRPGPARPTGAGIRAFTGFRECGAEDAEKTAEWPAGNVCQSEKALTPRICSRIDDVVERMLTLVARRGHDGAEAVEQEAQEHEGDDEEETADGEGVTLLEACLHCRRREIIDAQAALDAPDETASEAIYLHR
jgi:hypothetical protein